VSLLPRGLGPERSIRGIRVPLPGLGVPPDQAVIRPWRMRAAKPSQPPPLNGGTSSPRVRPQRLRDRRDVVDLSSRDTHDERIGVVVVPVEFDAVLPQNTYVASWIFSAASSSERSSTFRLSRRTRRSPRRASRATDATRRARVPHEAPADRAGRPPVRARRSREAQTRSCTRRSRSGSARET
jgi:hypothetical protein